MRVPDAMRVRQATALQKEGRLDASSGLRRREEPWQRMGVATAFRRCKSLIEEAQSIADLRRTVEEITTMIGCDYYAIGHHVDWGQDPREAFRLHNYPDDWAQIYDNSGFGGRDPVHRASGRTINGFLWRETPNYVEITGNDEQFMSLAQCHGIGDGFTVPANVMGELQGSCTFATAPGRSLNEDGLLIARLIGPELFNAARRLAGPPQLIDRINMANLTERQRDCLLWLAAGKSDWETGQILGIREETVRRHLKDGCRRAGVQRRTLLLFLAFRNGVISFPEVPFR